MDNVKILAGDKDLSGLSNVATFVQFPNSQDCRLSFRAFFGATGAVSVAMLVELAKVESAWVCSHGGKEDRFRGKIQEYSIESTKGTELMTCSVVVEGTSDAPITKLAEPPRFEKHGGEKKLEVKYGQNSS